MTEVSKVEPAGAERFRAVSYQEDKLPTMEVSLATLDQRLSELEAVVHEIAPYSRNANHSTVVGYLSDTRKRIQSYLKSKL